MGFNFKELAVTAMVSKNPDPNEFIVGGHNATVPAVDNEKRALGTDHNPNDSEEELAKIDTTAPDGVQRIQAMTHVWTKPNLILAYVL
jgi:hypothetical protein